MRISLMKKIANILAGLWVLDHKTLRIWKDFLREKTCVEFEGTVVRIVDHPSQSRMCKDIQ